MRMLGTITSLFMSAIAAIFFISSYGVTSLSVLVGGMVVAASAMVGRRYDHYAYLAKHDDLTECYNRRFIKEIAVKLMSQAEKSNKPLCIMLIDVDDFKKVNDDFGHRHGDHLLRTFSETLISVCPKTVRVARLGDDEFLAVAPNVNLEDMNRVMQSFHEILKFKYAGVKYSIGTALFPLHGSTFDELINHAERKMYSMKRFNAKEEYEEKYIEFIRNNQKRLMEHWFEGMANSKISKLVLPSKISMFFDYLLDLKVSLRQHQLFGTLPGLCHKLVDQNVPMEEVRRSFAIMRNLLIDQYEAPFIPFPIHVVKEVIGRLDELETATNHEYEKAELIKRENVITELHEDRLTLIGKMAASMAHEIRNPLTSIKGFLKLIRANIPLDSNPNIEKYINIIEGEFENIHMQITGLLSFSKKQIIEESFSYLSANQLLHSMISLLSPRLINENVELKVNEREVFYIHGQKVALQQVISNILNNGIDALSMNDDREKIMRIDIYNDDQASYISISNNGPEIPEEVRGVLFHPFTTTKEDGTGLGLAICKQIMEKNNGNISFVSKAEETTFTLTFYKDPLSEHNVG